MNHNQYPQTSPTLLQSFNLFFVYYYLHSLKNLKHLQRVSDSVKAMPMPWKKNNGVSRISRLVADFQTPKRGGSLVVETGFPTSLIDLFVKNRDRIKKQSKRKVSSQIQTPDIPSSSSSSSYFESPNPDNFKDSKIKTTTHEQNLDFIDNRNDNPLVEEVPAVNLNPPRIKIDFTDYDDGYRCCDNGRVLVAVLKMFLVVVLALSTHKLVVGITMSALMLIFLEFIGSRAFSAGGPCINPRKTFESAVNKAFRCGGDKNSLKETISRGVVEEIEPVESRHDICTPSVRGNDRERKAGIETEITTTPEAAAVVGDEANNDKEETSDERRNRKAKPKWKILRKIAPKKWFGLKKGGYRKKKTEMGTSSKLEMRTLESAEDEKSDIYEDPFTRLDEESDAESCKPEESDSVHVTSSKAQDIIEQKKGVVGEIEKVGLELEMKGKGKGKENSGYLILFLIVVAGLIGGKVLALVLTVACCLMSGCIGKAKRFMIR